MKSNFCEKCSKILPKGKIVCDGCGYDNPELIPLLKENIKRQVIIKRIILGVFVVVLVLFLNVNLLFPWQAETGKNKRAIFNYVNTYYPHAKVVRTHYESKSFNPWSGAIDTITFELDGIEFVVRAEQGEVIVDDFPKKISSG